jgi:cell fate regulator YaaT (PSP1 superfamily)
VEHLIEVAFKGNRREFFRWSFEAPPPLKAAIIVDVERGEDLGRVHATGDLAERRRVGTTHGKEQREPLRVALRLASQDDIARAEVLRADDETARRFAVQKARALNLQMKISDAEWQWDRRRLTFYFTAEERVDFRALVRQLETHFGVRVQMWHIGPRDEAKRLDGVGHCGRQLCSAVWLPELLPVKTSLAKEQRLSTITPTQISGACGRLMCCLRYEHEFYVAARKRFPKQGKIVQTLQGEEKVDATDIFRDLVTLRNPAGETRVIPLAQFRRELAGDATPVEEELIDAADDSTEEGEERVVTTQLQRAASAPPREQRRPEPRREPRGDAQGDARSDSRGDQRAGTRPAARGDGRGDTRGDTRGAKPSVPRRDERAPRPETPRTEPSRADAPRADAPRTEPPRTEPPRTEPPRTEPPRIEPPRTEPPRTEPSRTELPLDRAPRPAAAADGGAAGQAREPRPAAPDAPQDGAPSGDGEHRRGRRRRGRRGGRRHRGDNHNSSNNSDNSNTGGPNGGTPPSNPNR